MPPSSRGLGHRPFKPVTAIRIRLGAFEFTHHLPEYIEAGIVAKMLELAQGKPKDHLILRLMTDAGLRREEVTKRFGAGGGWRCYLSDSEKVWQAGWQT